MADEMVLPNSDEVCSCKAEEVVLLPCSGGSNCGQIANQAAVKLTEEGVGNIYCLAGIGAHIEGMVESARSAKRVVVLDGCQVACAKKTVEHVGLVVTDWICVTDEGIDKVHEFKLSAEDIALIAQRTRESLAKMPQAGTRKLA
jgi:uncharacterized metal-binding protein